MGVDDEILWPNGDVVFLIRKSQCRYMWKNRSLTLFVHRCVFAPSCPRFLVRHDTTMPTPPQPELPRPAHIDRESALGNKFGKEITNYFGSQYALYLIGKNTEQFRFPFEPSFVLARRPLIPRGRIRPSFHKVHVLSEPFSLDQVTLRDTLCHVR